MLVENRRVGMTNDLFVAGLMVEGIDQLYSPLFVMLCTMFVPKTTEPDASTSKSTSTSD